VHLLAEAKGALPALQALVAARADVALRCDPLGKFSDALFRAAGTGQDEAVEWLIQTESFNPHTKNWKNNSYYDATRGSCSAKTKKLMWEWCAH
jgi:hypothetical protein